MSSVTLTLPHTYGLVILTAVINWLVLMWQAAALGKARKQYNIPYPTMYENKYPSDFNCVQRVHQNSLEWNPPFLIFLLISGATTPIASAAAGMVYNIGRVYYAKGYYAGNPHKGLWGLYGLFYLIAASVYTAIALLRSSTTY